MGYPTMNEVIARGSTRFKAALTALYHISLHLKPAPCFLPPENVCIAMNLVTVHLYFFCLSESGQQTQKSPGHQAEQADAPWMERA